jgi:hypothetical protein
MNKEVSDCDPLNSSVSSLPLSLENYAIGEFLRPYNDFWSLQMCVGN